MMLKIETPADFIPERDYILGVLLDGFLGLPWRRVSGDRKDVRITLEGHVGEIRLPDIFFSMSPEDWLAAVSLPKRGLPRWDTRDFADDVTLVEATVPLIYGDPEPRARHEPNQVRLPVDIFGSAFFMLSRYEELVTPDRDEHDRFPAWASLAYQEGFLDRPIIDEYVELLWSAMASLWPRLERRKHTFRTFVSCDVDNPYAAYTKSWKGTLRKVGGDVLKRHSPTEACRSLRNAVATRRGDYRYDPFWTFDWMMDVNERAGNHLAFYFLMAHTVPNLDGHYSPDEPRIRQLMRRIHERGHEIGMHGSYATYRNPAQIQYEVSRLRTIFAEETIEQSAIGGRQHYLRWSSAETPKHLAAARLAYDTTLSFADHHGFRCGTCREYTMFDFVSRARLSIRQRSLLVMECTVLADRYLGLKDRDAALEQFSDLRAKAKQFNGAYSVLWHNSWLTNDFDKALYESVLG